MSLVLMINADLHSHSPVCLHPPAPWRTWFCSGWPSACFPLYSQQSRTQMTALLSKQSDAHKLSTAIPWFSLRSAFPSQPPVRWWSCLSGLWIQWWRSLWNDLRSAPSQKCSWCLYLSLSDHQEDLKQHASDEQCNTQCMKHSMHEILHALHKKLNAMHETLNAMYGKLHEMHETLNAFQTIQHSSHPCSNFIFALTDGLHELHESLLTLQLIFPSERHGDRWM